MFKATLTVLFLAALSVAHPGHGHGVPAAARAELVPRDDTNSTSADNSTAVVSNEVLPVFVTPCVCADPLCDSRLSAKYVSFIFQTASFIYTYTSIPCNLRVFFSPLRRHYRLLKEK